MTHTPNHWSNKETIINYVGSVIIPYMTQKTRQLGLDLKHTRLVILDECKEQTTSRILNLLQSNYLMYIVVPLNCTDCCNHWMSVSFELPSNLSKVNLITGNIVAQKNIDKDIEPVDIKLSIVKPITTKWMTVILLQIPR